MVGVGCSVFLSPPASSARSLLIPCKQEQLQPFSYGYCYDHKHRVRQSRWVPFRVQAAAKPPAGVVMPKAEPKFKPPFLGFTSTAEIWNSRACMMGLIGTFIVELILNKGILQLIGVDVGKGLDLPL